MIKDYAIIDHVGSLTTAEVKRVYKIAYGAAKNDNLEAHTLKKVCQADSPFAREISNKMKFRARYTKNPKKVYLICDKLNSNAEFVLNIWEERHIKVQVIEANPIQAEYKIDCTGEATLRRSILDIWGTAIGWNFSAPLIRVQPLNNIENFSKRSDHDDMVASGETHFSKPYTTAEMFIAMNKAIATDKEVTEAWKHLGGLAVLAEGKIELKPGKNFGAFLGSDAKMQEWLEPDYILCKECHRPIKMHLGDVECPHCKAILEENVMLDTYYDDSFKEDDFDYEF